MIEHPPVAEDWPEPTKFGVNIYDWRSWADGKERVATQGEHFHSTATAFAEGVRAWARRNGYIPNVAQRGSRVWFSLTPDPAGKPNPRELVAKFVDDELIPEPGAWISRDDVWANYQKWLSMSNRAPITKRQLFAGVRATYPLERRNGVTGFGGTR